MRAVATGAVVDSPCISKSTVLNVDVTVYLGKSSTCIPPAMPPIHVRCVCVNPLHYRLSTSRSSARTTPPSSSVPSWRTPGALRTRARRLRRTAFIFLRPKSVCRSQCICRPKWCRVVCVRASPCLRVQRWFACVRHIHHHVGLTLPPSSLQRRCRFRTMWASCERTMPDFSIPALDSALTATSGAP